MAVTPFNLLIADVATGNGVREHNRSGNAIQNVIAGIGADWHITQVCDMIILAPTAGGDILKYDSSGVALGTFVPASEVTPGPIRMSQSDNMNNLYVMYGPGTTQTIKKFSQDGILLVNYGTVGFSDGLEAGYSQIGADVSPDGTAIFVIAGEYTTPGTKNIPVYRIALEGGTATVIDRWATAISGTDSSPGGGNSIDGGTVIAGSSETCLVVVARRIWPAQGDAGTTAVNAVEDYYVGPGQEVVTTFYSGDGNNYGGFGFTPPSSVLTVPRPLVADVNMSGIFVFMVPGTGQGGVTQIEVQVRGPDGGSIGSISRGVGEQGFGNYPFGPAQIVFDAVMEGGYQIVFMNHGTADVVWNASKNLGIAVNGLSMNIATTSSVQYLAKTLGPGGLASESIIHAPQYENNVHRPFIGIPKWLALDPFGGTVWIPLGYDDVDSGTFLFAGSSVVKEDLFNDGVAYDQIPIYVWSTSTCGPTAGDHVITVPAIEATSVVSIPRLVNIISPSPIGPTSQVSIPSLISLKFPGIARVPRVGTTQDLFVRTTP